MSVVNVAQAKARLPSLLEAALRGEEVVIARRNVPLVRLAPIESAKLKPRFGKLRGCVALSRDFDEPLSEFVEYSPRRSRR